MKYRTACESRPPRPFIKSAGEPRFNADLQNPLRTRNTDTWRREFFVPYAGNRITDEQSKRLAHGAQECGYNRVGIMHDADGPGDDGAKESLWRMHEQGIDAYLVWSRRKFDGRFVDRQPESLTEEEWKEITREL